MIDLTAYRARIGAFASVPTRLRIHRGAVREEKRRRRSRRSCSLVAVVLAVMVFTVALLCLSAPFKGTGSTRQAMASYDSSLVVLQCVGTKAWVNTFAVRDYLIGNHGAHMYNGNPPTSSQQPKKQQRTTTAHQPTLAAFAFGKTLKDRYRTKI